MKFLTMLSLLFLVNTAWADVAQNVTIEKPFARAASMQQNNSAAFMKITNQGADASIVNASSPVSEVVELHTHINDEGVMRMRKIDKIELPSGDKVMLKPGGLHVMLIKLKQDLKVGDTINVTLEFSDGSKKALDVPVQKVMMKHKKGMSGDHKKMMAH